MKHRQLADVASWAGVTVDPAMERTLHRFEAWLADEAAPAGGIGPQEAPQVWERHVLDSLMFARPLVAERPPLVVDAGTGVGLPGLPLAIVLPRVQWRLVDRSGRRLRLVRRAVRLLGLENVDPVESSVERLIARDGPVPAVVMRGVLPAGALSEFVIRSVAPGGIAVVGGGLEPEAVPGSELDRFPGSEVLAPGRWLRIMRRP